MPGLAGRVRKAPKPSPWPKPRPKPSLVALLLFVGPALSRAYVRPPPASSLPLAVEPTVALRPTLALLALSHPFAPCRAGPIGAGLWGIAFFREVDGCDALIWMCFAFLCAASLVMLGMQMHSDHGNPHHNNATAPL